MVVLTTLRRSGSRPSSSVESVRFTQVFPAHSNKSSASLIAPRITKTASTENSVRWGTEVVRASGVRATISPMTGIA